MASEDPGVGLHPTMSSLDILPPLPKGGGWDPTVLDDNLFRKHDERRRNKDDLSHITSILQCAGVISCFVGVKALQNFGARRISDVCVALDLTLTTLTQRSLGCRYLRSKHEIR